MPKAFDLTGSTFGRLNVISRVENTPSGKSSWSARCECGSVKSYVGSALVSGHTQSCGCYSREQTATRNHKHGCATRDKAKRPRAYGAWLNMLLRCKFDKHYKHKVTVCEAWRNSFVSFYDELGDCPDGYELDRIDNSKGYEPGNCRWVTEAAQTRNTSRCKLTLDKAKEIRMSSKTERELAELYGVNRSTINKIKRGVAWHE